MPRKKRQARSPQRSGQKPYYQKGSGHSDDKRRRFIQLMLDGITPEVAATQIDVSFRKAIRLQQNLRRYGSISMPFTTPSGRPNKLTITDEKAFLEALLDVKWMYQDEMKAW